MKDFKINSMVYYFFGIFLFFLVLISIFKNQIFEINLISGDIGDARFNLYILEHQWLSFIGERNLFDSHFFYPATRVLFYSDTLFTVSPFYFLFRFLNFNLFQSFQLWIYTCLFLNFITFLWILNYWFKDKLLNILGALIFTFALPRLYQIGHAQLLCQFYVILSFHFLYKYLIKKNKNDLFLFSIFAVLQFYAVWYYAWFWFFTLFVLLFIYLFSKQRRGLLLKFLIDQKKDIIVAILIGLILLLPLGIGYISVYKATGSRSYSEARDLLPTFLSWFSYPPYHWINHIFPWMENIKADQKFSEKTLGLGLIFIFGFVPIVYRSWKENYLKPLIVFLLIVFLFTLKIENYSLWIRFYELVPLAKSIRAVARIGIYLIPFQLFILINYFDKSNSKKISILFLSFVLFEQICPIQTYFNSNELIENTNLLAKKLDSNCQSFYLSDRKGENTFFVLTHLEAMFINLKTGVPTINGYSGNEPPGYPPSLSQTNIIDDSSKEEKISKIKTWAQNNPCIISR